MQSMIRLAMFRVTAAFVSSCKSGFIGVGGGVQDKLK